MDSGEEEVENSHYWVGEGEEMYGVSGHKKPTQAIMPFQFPNTIFHLKIFQ